MPFCLSVCPYCDFVVYAGRDARGPVSRTAHFLDAVHRELELRADAADATFGPPQGRDPLGSVYFGGGTPSLLAAADVAALLERIDCRFGIARDAEVTLEVNPGRDDRGDLRGFRAAGVNRLSVGAQSMQPAELRALGRRHSPRDVADTVERARAAAFDNVSVDLLYDIPGQTAATWEQSLTAVIRLGADHLSAYALALDDPETEGLAGPLGDHLPVRSGARQWRARARKAQHADRAADLYELADALLGRAGYRWYELSNWARPGRESRHNLAYWRHAAYEAVGPGAHAYDGGRRRRWNAAALGGYLAALSPADGSDARLPPEAGEELDGASLKAERAILALRLADGIPVPAPRNTALDAALRWGRENALLEERPGGALALTLRGRLVSNELFARLVQIPVSG